MELQELMELRCQMEVVQRWLGYPDIPDDLKGYLRAALLEIEGHLRESELAGRQSPAAGELPDQEGFRCNELGNEWRANKR
jgi:hypothetical protein